MEDMSLLGTMILNHWTTRRPETVKELERTNQLESVLRQAREQTGDLLYNLIVVQKMNYQAAWELATREWAFLPPDAEQPFSDRPKRPSSETSPSPSHPAISE
jgi:hypothetical protein